MREFSNDTFDHPLKSYRLLFCPSLQRSLKANRTLEKCNLCEILNKKKYTKDYYKCSGNEEYLIKDTNQFKRINSKKFFVCVDCKPKLVDHSDWVRAGIPKSIVRLFARKKISEDELLKLFSVYNKDIERWQHIICEIILRHLPCNLFEHAKPFDACIKLKEMQTSLHVDEIELLLRTRSKKEHLEFLVKLIAMEQFEFLVERFYQDGQLMKKTYLLDMDTGILSLDYVSVEKWITYFLKHPNRLKKEVEFINELLSQETFHEVAQKIYSDKISMANAMDLYYFCGFDKHPNALMEVIQGANWKAVAVKNGFYEF